MISTAEALKQVDQRLSYFRQLAVILGAVSLVVGFLLVTTLVTVSVNERIGEIAVMRAIGVRRWRVVAQILLESSALMLVGAPLGLVLGLVTARWLNSILARFPGLPERHRLLSLPAARRVDRARAARAERHPRRHLSVVAERIAADRRDAPAGGGRLTAIVEVRDLVREYRMGEERVPALRGVSFTIQQGDYVAIVGPSGCGKSTLLNLLGVIDRPTSGTVSIAGERVDQLRRCARDGVPTAPHRLRLPALLPHAGALRARERRAAAGRSGAAGDAERRARALELLEYVGLGRRERHRPSQLSGGEQQRVAIARALANRPALLLADEPTGELDARTGAEMIALFERLNADGTTIVVVTHDEDLARAAKRVIHMRDGTIVADARNDPEDRRIEPARGSTYAIAEDHVDPRLLFAGTEFAAYVSRDGGQHWTKIGGLPTIAVREIAIQKRENDLVIGTFGRGVYIVDDYSPLRLARPEPVEGGARSGQALSQPPDAAATLYPGPRRRAVRSDDAVRHAREGVPGRDALLRAESAVRRRAQLFTEGRDQDAETETDRRRKGRGESRPADPISDGRRAEGRSRRGSAGDLADDHRRRRRAGPRSDRSGREGFPTRRLGLARAGASTAAEPAAR